MNTTFPTIITKKIKKRNKSIVKNILKLIIKTIKKRKGHIVKNIGKKIKS